MGRAIGLLAFAAAVQFAVAMSMPNQADAARPGADPTLTVTPMAAATQSTASSVIRAASWIHIAGCGYQPGGVILVMNSPTAMSFTGASVDAGGCIGVDWTVNSLGAYTLDARQDGSGNKSRVVASTSFTVQ